MKKTIKLIVNIILLLTLNTHILAQVNVASSTYSGVGYIGWSTAGGAVPFQIAGTQYMTLTTGGLFGIGTSFSPNYKLDVDAGDININTPTNGLRLGSTALGSQFILRNNDIYSSIYLGVFSGNTNTSDHNNTFVGYATGYNTGNTIAGSNNEGSLNTFVGS